MMTNSLHSLFKRHTSLWLASLLSLLITPSAFALANIDVEGAALHLTKQQSAEMAQQWASALEVHEKKLSDAFNVYKPGNYCGYKRYKTEKWSPAFNNDHDQVYTRWFSIQNRWAERNRRLHEIFTAWANLNSASIYMENYLCTGNKDDLKNAQRKLKAVTQTLSGKPNARENTLSLVRHS